MATIFIMFYVTPSMEKPIAHEDYKVKKKHVIKAIKKAKGTGKKLDTQ